MTSINQYICFDCECIFSQMFSCPICGSETFASLEDKTDQTLFIGSEPMLSLLFNVDDEKFNRFASDIQNSGDHSNENDQAIQFTY